MRNGKQLKRYTSSEPGPYSTVTYRVPGAKRLVYYQAISYSAFSLIRSRSSGNDYV